MSGLRYGWEKFAEVVAEPNFTDLLKAHWYEVGIDRDKMPLDFDYDRLQLQEDAGLLRVWTARADKTLVGYIGWFVMPHPYFRTTLTAFDDGYVLDPAWRRGLTGLRFIASAFDALRELGVKRIVMHSKVHFLSDRGGLDPVFKRLGFEHTDNLWSLML